MSHKPLVDQQQPFGSVEKHTMHTGQGRPATTHTKPGSTSEIPNHGVTEVKSFADKNPNAEAQASAHKNDPFFWTGRPPKG